jgi:hypothetical protein
LQYLGLPLLVWSLRRRDFQHLKDKCAGKLPTWNGKFIAVVGRVSLVKSVIDSKEIYHLTPLYIPPGTLKYLNKFEKAFIRAAKDTTTGAKCKVNWDIVRHPKIYGGLGILHLKKIALSLCLRWPWLEWKDPTKIWVGSGNPCTKEDMDLFYGATTILLAMVVRLLLGMLIGF